MPSTDPAGRVPGNARQGHRLGAALLAVPLLATAGWLGRKAAEVPRDLPLPEPVSGQRFDLSGDFGHVAVYGHGAASPARSTPLLLIHSINAAGSAYEVRPIFEHYAGLRPVYAFDLPGYGHSQRADRIYTPRLMTEALVAVAEAIRERHGMQPIDALALSLSSEFLARAATEHPDLFRSVALVSPTGFDRRGPRLGPPGSNKGMPPVYRAVSVGLWRRALFDMLVSRVSIRYFLEKTFGSKRIDEGLVDYDYVTTHQRGAEYAPYSFLSGFLFSADVTRLYDALRLPVWMVHGTKGDFQDYSGKGRVEGKANWTIDVLQTGALPQFEVLDQFTARYDAFLARSGGD